jgi:hypothetical protein
LQALRFEFSQSVLRGLAPNLGLGRTQTVRVDKLAFPLALLEQNLRILRLANLRFALRNASFLQLSKNSFSNRFENLRARRSAALAWSRSGECCEKRATK